MNGQPNRNAQMRVLKLEIWNMPWHEDLCRTTTMPWKCACANGKNFVLARIWGCSPWVKAAGLVTALPAYSATGCSPACICLCVFCVSVFPSLNPPLSVQQGATQCCTPSILVLTNWHKIAETASSWHGVSKWEKRESMWAQISCLADLVRRFSEFSPGSGLNFFEYDF